MENVGLCFEEHNVIQLIGLQSLFYFLGHKINEFSHVSWVTKEQMFLSKDFIDTTRRFGFFLEWRTITLNRFRYEIKVNFKIWFPFKFKTEYIEIDIKDKLYFNLEFIFVARIIYLHYPGKGYINPKKLTKFFKKVYPLPPNNNSN